MRGRREQQQAIFVVFIIEERVSQEYDDCLNGWLGFKGPKRSNATHPSVVDPDTRLMSKSGVVVGGA